MCLVGSQRSDQVSRVGGQHCQHGEPHGPGYESTGLALKHASLTTCLLASDHNLKDILRKKKGCDFPLSYGVNLDYKITTFHTCDIELYFVSLSQKLKKKLIFYFYLCGEAIPIPLKRSRSIIDLLRKSRAINQNVGKPFCTLNKFSSQR